MSLPARPFRLLAPCLLAGALCGGVPQDARTHRVEHFELRGAPDGPALGYASLHRTDLDGEAQLEWQIHFGGDSAARAAGSGEQVDVWQVETLGPAGARCIWRERASERSRSIVADRSGAALELLEWGRRTPLRQTVASSAPPLFPLELEERLRAGEAPDSVALFDPLSSAVEPLRVEVRETDVLEGGCLRAFDLVRADGSLAMGWTFLGEELASFRWQRGGLCAVRVEEQRVARHLLSTSVDGPRPSVPPVR